MNENYDVIETGSIGYDVDVPVNQRSSKSSFAGGVLVGAAGATAAIVGFLAATRKKREQKMFERYEQYRKEKAEREKEVKK